MQSACPLVNQKAIEKEVGNDIKAAIRTETFYKLGLNTIKQIVDGTKVNEFDIETKKDLVSKCIDIYGDEGLSILRNIHFGRETDIDTVVDFLSVLDTVPIMKVVKDVILNMKESHLSSDDEMNDEYELENLKKELDKAREKIAEMDRTNSFLFMRRFCMTKNENDEVLALIKAKNIQAVAQMLEKDPSLLYSSNSYGETLLCSFAASGWLEGVELLLKISDKNQQFIDAYSHDARNKTALMIACSNKHQKVAEYLLENGANINLRDANGETALVNACNQKDLNMVKFLVSSGADMNVKNCYGKNAFIVACLANNISIIDYLLHNGADVDSMDHNGITSLMEAASRCNLKIVKYLISKGAKVSIKDKFGKDALYYASEASNTMQVKQAIVNLLTSKF